VDFSFCRPLQQLIVSQRVIGRTGKVFDGLSGLTTTNSLQVLRSLMLELKPASTLEVGLSFGGSAMTIAATHRDLDRAANRQHIAIDPYQRTVWDSTGIAALEQAGLQDYVELREQFSAIALAELTAQGRSFDLIYVDGSHRFDDVFVDAYFGVRLLAPNGVIVFDDSATTEVGSVLRFVGKNLSEWVTEFDLSPYRNSDVSWQYMLAKRLGRIQLRAFRRIGDEPEWNARLRL
jgi:cephalosporin hydroxylase